MARRPRTSNIAIDLGQGGVAAIKVRRGASTAVLNSLLVQRPAEVSFDDPESFGRWLGDHLTASGIGRGAATFVLDRNAVSIRQLDLPSTDPSELVEMVRLALERELPIDTEGAAIDFVPLDTQENSTRVQAVAVPRVELDRIASIASAAGVTVRSVTLRCLGAANIVTQSRVFDEGVLIVDVSHDRLEVALSYRGELVFSRGIGLNQDGAGAASLEQLTVEVRRSWLSYRVSGGEVESPVVVVIGGENPDHLVEELAEATGLEAIAFTGGAAVRSHASMKDVWPLVGVLSGGPEHINLAAPRKVRNRAARNRQMALSILGVAIVAGGIGWSVGSRQLAALEAKTTDLNTKANGTLQEHLRFMRDGFLRTHLEEWRGVRPDWLEHLLAVTPRNSTPKHLVFEDFSGVLDADPTVMDQKGVWTTPASVQLTLEGEAASRATAFALRDHFVADRRYTLKTGGADQTGGSVLAFPFRFSLRSEALEPGELSSEDGAP